MFPGIIESAAPIFILIVMGYIVKLFLDYKTRKKLIEQGMVNENIKHLFEAKMGPQNGSSLKWGLVLFLVGLVVLVLSVLPTYISGEVIFGATLIAAGLGLLVYYIIASARAKETIQKPL
jgi:Ca2+/H+ antiporter